MHHVHTAARRGDPEPTLVCRCPGGLIHMHDCPVMNGRECRHFEPGAGEPVDLARYDEIHGELMEDFLSRPYAHRIRILSVDEDAWTRRRRALEEHYAAEAEETLAEEDLTPDQAERYEKEKERLIEQRKRREEARAEREAKTREEKARERAKMGIKTVVERAQESVAARGNVSDSIVDEMPAPQGGKKKKRRRRRRRKDEKGEGSAPKSGEGAPKRRRKRRRRRRKPPGDGGQSA